MVLNKEERRDESAGVQWVIEQFYGMFKKHKGLDVVLNMLVATHEK